MIVNKKEYKDKVLRLSGDEGDPFVKLRISGNSWGLPEKDINFYVKVVGFKDRKADRRRSWGHRTFKNFVGKPKVKYKYKIIVVEPTLKNVWRKWLARIKK